MVDDTDDHDKERVHTGRLFTLRLKRSAHARQTALESIRQLPNGRWQVRIGGRVRGRTLEFSSRRSAEEAVHDHYNEAMLQFVRQQGGK